MQEQWRGGGGTSISNISRLSGNVASKIMVCLWHTVFERKE